MQAGVILFGVQKRWVGWWGGGGVREGGYGIGCCKTEAPLLIQYRDGSISCLKFPGCSRFKVFTNTGAPGPVFR